MRGLHGLHVHGGQGQDCVQMLVGEVFLLHRAQRVDLREVEILALGEVQDGLALRGGEELSPVVQELEGVPLARIVAGGEDDAAVGMGEEDGHLGGRRRCEAALDDVDAAPHEGADDELLHHVARKAGVLAHDDLVAVAVRLGLPSRKRGGIGRGELDDVDGSEGVSGDAADGAADAGNGFDQGHMLFISRHSRLDRESLSFILQKY